jgi:nucleoside-triphosphatase THEP1
LKNEHNIIVGRKGCGKTASFYYLNDYFSKDVRNVMCVIKPNSFQIDALLYLLRQARENFQIYYLVESSWKFLIFTEIARAFYERISVRPLYALTPREQEFLEYIESHKDIVLIDFSARLETKLQALQKEFDSVLGASQHDFMAKVSEHLHNTTLYEIRDFVSDLAPKSGRIVVLIDNLDKSWKVNNDLGLLSEWVLGLLSVSGRIASDISVVKSKGASVEFTLTIFLRTDILNRVLQASREPDKIERTELTYDDMEILFRIVEERYEVLNTENSKEFDFWRHYVADHVQGEKVKDFIFARVFPRPRDLLRFISHAKDMAVARGHAKIEEADLIKAHELYSEWVLSSLFVENGITQAQMEDFIYQLAGNSQIISEGAVITAMELTGIDTGEGEKIDYFIDHLVALSILGREVSENVFMFEYDLSVNKRNKIVASRAQLRRYKIHNALTPALQLK